MRKTLSGLAVLAALSGSAVAEESQPITIQAVSDAEAPFKLSVTNARLVREPGGQYSVAFEVGVTNLTAGSLMTTSGWSLDIAKRDGTLVRRVKVAQGFDVDAGETVKARHVLDSRAVGTVDPSDKFTLAPATGATVNPGQRCQGPDGTCEGVEARCQLLCNNPLAPQGGLASFSCSCYWYWDSTAACWRYVCPFTCECVGLPEPPYHDPYLRW